MDEFSNWENGLLTRRWELVLALVGVILVGAGVFWFKSERTKPPEVEILETTNTASKVVVDVGGAVVAPRVYSLPVGSRVADGIAAAGGLTAEADLKWVEKNLNQSQVLKDGQKVYIWKQGELEETVVGGGESGGLINLNKATTDQLESLPGVGPVTAGKIITGRPYSSTQELVDRKIVNQSVWEQIQDKISL